MKINIQILTVLLTLGFFNSYNSYGQDFGEDPNAVEFLLKPGHALQNKPSFCQRLSGVKDVYLLEPLHKSEWDNYIYGNLAYYFHQLGLKVKVIPTSDYKKTSKTLYGAPVLWCNFNGDVSDYCEQSNSLIVGISYGTSPGSKDHVLIWVKDVPNNYYWEFHLSNVPNKSEKLLNQYKKTLCSSYTFNETWKYEPRSIGSNLTEQKIKKDYYNGERVAIYQGDDYRICFYPVNNDDYFLIYLGGKDKNKDWQIGDIKALLERTEIPNVYMGTWWGKWKQMMECKVVLTKGMLKTYIEDENENIYLQVFPASNDNNIKDKYENNW